MSSRIRSRRALHLAFSLVVHGEPRAQAYFDELAADLIEAPRSPHIEYAIQRLPGADRSWELTRDGLRIASSESPTQLNREWLQDLNGQAIATWPGVVCHAGCVSRDGRAVVLPADPDAGKTTLTAGLVRAGFEYVTDEGVAFTTGTTHITPYPKPLSLDEGSWPLFPELEPHADLLFDDYKSVQWLVPSGAIRPDAVSGPCDARWIVFPRYVGGEPTELRPIGRAEALVELAKNTFNFNQHSRDSLEQLEVVVRACDCYRLDVGALGDAVAVIERLFADA